MLKVVAVIQARMGSTRLPGKVLLPLHGRPLLERMITRVRQAKTLDEVVVATTRSALDSSIVKLAAALGVRCVIGHPDDLIDRHRQAARETEADAVVKIPSDCPLIDPAIIDQTVAFFRADHPRHDYVSNLHPATWPDGNDVEVMGRDALETAWREAKRPYEREHTTPFIWDQPDRFSVGNVVWSGGRDLSASHRIVLDFPEDYAVISALYEALAQVDDARAFTVDAIVSHLDAHPELKATNAMHLGKSWIQAHLRDLRTLSNRTPFEQGGGAPGGAAIAGP
ncbi:MAG TPA: glycosyltransferase family protein [Polyangia bacterium]|nr:glycosyltransferase family protein [Polyangia bacterium]